MDHRGTELLWMSAGAEDWAVALGVGFVTDLVRRPGAGTIVAGVASPSARRHVVTVVEVDDTGATLWRSTITARTRAARAHLALTATPGRTETADPSATASPGRIAAAGPTATARLGPTATANEGPNAAASPTATATPGRTVAASPTATASDDVVVTLSDDGSTYRIARSGVVTRVLAANSARPTGVAVRGSSDGRAPSIVLSDSRGDLVWQLPLDGRAAPRPLAHLEPGSWPAGIACDSAGRVLVACRGRPGVATVEPERDGAIIRPLGFVDTVGDAAAPTAPTSVVCDSRDRVFVLDASRLWYAPGADGPARPLADVANPVHVALDDHGGLAVLGYDGTVRFLTPRD